MKLIHAQQLFAQRDVFVHLVHVLMDRFDQVVIDRCRHLGIVQRGSQRVLVFPRVREEFELLELAVQRRSHRIFVLAQAVVVGIEDLLPEVAVRAFEQRNKAAVGQRMDVSVLIGHVRKTQLGVAQRGADVVGCAADLPGHGQDLFALGRKDMRSFAAQLVQAPSIFFERRLLRIEAVQRLLGDGHDLGPRKGAGAGQADQRTHRLAAHRLEMAVCSVDVTAQTRVAVDPARQKLDLILQAEPFQKSGSAFTELAGKGSDLLFVGADLFKAFLPGGFIGKNMADVPGEFFRDFVSFGNGHVETSFKYS